MVSTSSKWRGTAVGVVLVTLLSWRDVAWRPVVAGLNSWQAGLSLGFLHHLQWGPQLLFTFGPYGFLEDILPISRLTAALAFLYAFAVTSGLAVLSISRLRTRWGWTSACAASWAAIAIAANTVEAPELGSALSLGLFLAVLDGGSGPPDAGAARRGARHGQWLPAALGAFSALQLVIEINVGLLSVFLAVLALAATRRRAAPSFGGAAVATGAAFAGAIVVLLLAGRQSISNFPSYLRGSWSVLAGYAPAMATSHGRSAENWYALVDLILLAVVVLRGSRGRPPGERWAVLVGVTIWAWEVLKEGFVRHDKHDLIFFGLVLVGLCLVRPLRGVVGFQALAIALAALLACLAGGGPPTSVRSPLQDAGALAAEVRDLTSPGRWARVENYARLQVRATGGSLEGETLGALGGYTFAAVPFESSLGFEYPSLDWRPLPVLQGYSAYTSYLDEKDAAFLSGRRAPERILFGLATIDGRNPFWDPPATMQALYCHYRPVTRQSAGTWLVLRRVPDRCGPPRLISREVVHFGDAVKVPPVPPGAMEVGAFALAGTFAGTVEGWALKPAPYYATLGGQRYRFVQATDGDDHVMSVPRTSGFPPDAEPESTRSVTFTGGGWKPGAGSVTATFYSVAIRSGG